MKKKKIDDVLKEAKKAILEEKDVLISGKFGKTIELTIGDCKRIVWKKTESSEFYNIEE